jgi:septal ring factor EnvC (AmiA/AmiB activator)
MATEATNEDSYIQTPLDTQNQTVVIHKKDSHQHSHRKAARSPAFSLARKLDQVFSRVTQSPLSKAFDSVEVTSLNQNMASNTKRVKQRQNRELAEMVKELELKIKRKRAQIVEVSKETETLVHHIRESEMTMESLYIKMEQEPAQ